MRGTTRSYINVNPQLSSVIASLGGITDSINLMKNGWWKRGASIGGGAGSEEDDVHGKDAAPAVSFSSSSASSSPKNDMTVSFAVDDGVMRDQDCHETGVAVPTTVGSDTSSPPTSCLKKNTKQNISIDSMDKRGPDGSKRAKISFINNDDNKPYLDQTTNTNTSPMNETTNANTTPSPIHDLNDQLEEGSDATQIYSVPDIQNSETQLDHEFGDGSFGNDNHNCWSNETHRLNQSCPIPSDDMEVSPISKIDIDTSPQEYSMSDSRGDRKMEVQKKAPPVNDGGGNEDDDETFKCEDLSTDKGKDPSRRTQQPTIMRQQERGKRKTWEVQGITTALEAEAISTCGGVARAPQCVGIAAAGDDIDGENHGAEEDDIRPFVFLLSSPMSLPASDLRCLRKCLKKERFFMFQNHRNVSSSTASNGSPDIIDGPCFDLEFNFDFESEDDVTSFLSMLFWPKLRSEVGLSPLDEVEQDDCPSIKTSCCYAICSNSEFQTCDGFIAPRSFQYLLAVACGLPIVDISYVRSAASGSGNGPKSGVDHHYLYAPEKIKENKLQGKSRNNLIPPSRMRRTRGKDLEKSQVAEKVTHRIVGDVQSSDWTGPERARAAVLGRLSSITDLSLPFDNGLLCGYTILLCETYDTIPTRKPKVTRALSKKRSRAGRSTVVGGGMQEKEADETSPNLYSRGRLSFLLALCGAEVHELEAYSKDRIKKGAAQVDTKFSGHKIVVLSNGDRGFCNLAQQLALKCTRNKRNTISIVDLKWVLDSIAEFKVKDLDDYRVKTDE